MSEQDMDLLDVLGKEVKVKGLNITGSIKGVYIGTSRTPQFRIDYTTKEGDVKEYWASNFKDFEIIS